MRKILIISVAAVCWSCSSTPEKSGTSAKASHPDKTEVVNPSVTPKTQVQRAAKELDRDIVSTLIFRPGSRRVTSGALEELDRAISEARERGEIETVDVAVWSDGPYPKEGRAAPKQVNLAEDRGENIEKYISSRDPAASVRVHNMAKNPSALAKLLKTPDASIKEKLVSLGIADPRSGRLEDRSSSALVFIKLKE